MVSAVRRGESEFNAAEANKILKILSDTNDSIELTHSYFPENNLGWLYYK